MYIYILHLKFFFTYVHFFKVDNLRAHTTST